MKSQQPDKSPTKSINSKISSLNDYLNGPGHHKKKSYSASFVNGIDIENCKKAINSKNNNNISILSQPQNAHTGTIQNASMISKTKVLASTNESLLNRNNSGNYSIYFNFIISQIKSNNNHKVN